MEHDTAFKSVAAALRDLPPFERAIVLALLDEHAGYGDLARRFGVSAETVEQAFAAALVRLAAAVDRHSLPPTPGRFRRTVAATARLARRLSRR